MTWALTLWNDPTPLLQWGVVILAALIGAITDLSYRRIPNWLTFSLFFAGMIHAFIVGTWGGLLDGTLAALVMSFPCLLLFIFAGGGAGDVKKMAAFGMWLGLINGLVTLLTVSLCGTLLGVLYAASHGRAKEVLTNVLGMAHGVVGLVTSKGRVGNAYQLAPSRDSMLKMPYGVAIFVGVCVSAAGVWLWRT